MHRIIFFNDFLDDPTIRMLTGPLSSVGKKYSKNNNSGLCYFLVGMLLHYGFGYRVECPDAPNKFF